MDKDFKPTYASLKNDHIEAIIAESFRFANEGQVKERLVQLGKTFIRSKARYNYPDESALILWIEGFEITPDEKEKGHLGNYAAINYKPHGDKFTLYAQKIEVDIKTHPQKRRPKTAQPNWGHPTLRMAKKKKVFATYEEAQELLSKLHEEYPTTSIPLGSKLNIMIYSRANEGPSPIKKYTLAIREQEGGGFALQVEEKKTPKTPSFVAENTEKQGRFTTMVLKKRKGKK